MQNNVVNDDKTIRFEFENLSDSVYIGNDLQIRYFVDNKILHIDIKEIQTNTPKLNYLFPIEVNYPIYLEKYEVLFADKTLQQQTITK
jgi:hypothetical protein